jgi:hypothetical protein
MNTSGHENKENTFNPQHHSFIRRVLFPYSGTEYLTFSQSVRLILAWVAFFLPGILILTLTVALLERASLLKLLLALLFALVIDVLTFGATAWLSIAVNNRAVRIQQARRAQRTQGMTTTRGGTYGS